MSITVRPIENELRDGSQMKSIVSTLNCVMLNCTYRNKLFRIPSLRWSYLGWCTRQLWCWTWNSYGSLLNDVLRVSYVIHLMLFPIVFFSLLLNMDGHFFLCAIPFAYDNRRFHWFIATLVCLVFFGASGVPKICVAF